VDQDYGGGLDDWGYSVNREGWRLHIAGYTYSYGAGGSDVYLIKTIQAGHALDQNLRGNERRLRLLRRTDRDGGYIISGYTNLRAGLADVYLHQDRRQW